MNDTTMGNQQASDFEIGWLAGIIDGEGYLGITKVNRKDRKSPNCVYTDLQITNTDTQIVERCASIIRKLGVNPYVLEKTHNVKLNPQWKTSYNICLRKFSDIVKILEAVYPHLGGEKQAKARLLLDFVRTRVGKSRSTYDEESITALRAWDANHTNGAPTTIPQGSSL